MTPARSLLVLFPGSSVLSLVSLLLIAGGASISLLHATEDQTGRAVSEISSAFRAALGHEPGAPVEASSEKRKRESALRSLPDRRPGVAATDNTDWLAERRLESSLHDDEPDRPVIDGDADAFRNLLAELQRFSQGSALQTFCGSAAVEIAAADADIEEALAVHTADLLRQACTGKTNGADIECELTLWSSSPTTSAWIRAAIDAEEFRCRVFSLAIASGMNPPTISSCSRIWTDPVKTPPAATVMVRIARHK